MSSERIPVGDAVIEVQIEGHGDSIVLLPGAGGDGASFGAFAQRLAAGGLRTIAVSPRGARGSTGPMDGLTMHDLAADVAAVIGSLDAAPAHVLGRAFGNRVARCLAADRPELVRSIILAAAGGLVAPSPGNREAMARITAGEPGTDEWKRDVQVALISPATNVDALEMPKLWLAVARMQAAANAATPVPEWWDAGGAPMLVIQGLDDAVAPPANGQALKDAHGDRVELVNIPDAGHMVLLEKPDEVAGLVLNFIARH